MYFKKIYSETVETITFGAVGGLCFSRDLRYTDGNMLADVDPYSHHPQVPGSYIPMLPNPQPNMHSPLSRTVSNATLADATLVL